MRMSTSIQADSTGVDGLWTDVWKDAAMSEDTATTTAELGSLDGRLAPVDQLSIPVTDEGLLRGDGIFEVIRVYDGTPFALRDHLDRLERSGANLRLPKTFRAELESEIPELLTARGGAEFDGVLRVVVTRGGRRILLTEPAAPMPDGVRLGIVTYAPTRVLDGIKSLSYGANMLCSRLARERGFDEALLVTPHGRALEAPTPTLFWVDADGRLCTPPLAEHILASITRDRLLSLLDVEERSCPIDTLLGAGECFLASTIREVQAIGAIEETEFAEGPRTREAAEAFRAHVEAELAKGG
jgi:branched-chain amino acid aminotransferase